MLFAVEIINIRKHGKTKKEKPLLSLPFAFIFFCYNSNSLLSGITQKLQNYKFLLILLLNNWESICNMENVLSPKFKINTLYL